MRARGKRLSVGSVCVALLGAGVGCQQQPVAKLPKPRFEAPLVAKASLPPARTVPQLPALSATVNGVPRAWAPVVKPRQWSWIIIHHTATPAGSLARIETAHRARGFDSAGYDFVIGNGTETQDGQVEVGPRWPKQLVGAHTKSPDKTNKYNEHGIGVVMVGNFDQTRPSKKQVESCAKLVAYLMKTYKVPPDRVFGHRSAKPTDCPGKFTDVLAIRRAAVKILADAGEPIPQDDHRYAMGTEMLRDVTP